VKKIVLLLLVAGVLCVGSFLLGFVAGKLSEGLKDGLFPPTYATDAEVVKLVGDWIEIPPGAKNLAIFEYGMPDTDVWIAMEVPATERERLMSVWLAKAGGPVVPLGKEETVYLSPLQREIRVRQWVEKLGSSRFDFLGWEKPEGFSSTGLQSSADPGCQYAFIFDRASDRVVLVYFDAP
jgi:hypothetical protein